MSPAAGGRHRLQMVCPSLYTRLAAAADGDTTTVQDLMEYVASPTVSAARTALDVNTGGVGLTTECWSCAGSLVECLHRSDRVKQDLIDLVSLQTRRCRIDAVRRNM